MHLAPPTAQINEHMTVIVSWASDAQCFYATPKDPPGCKHEVWCHFVSDALVNATHISALSNPMTTPPCVKITGCGDTGAHPLVLHAPHLFLQFLSILDPGSCSGNMRICTTLYYMKHQQQLQLARWKACGPMAITRLLVQFQHGEFGSLCDLLPKIP